VYATWHCLQLLLLLLRPRLLRLLLVLLGWCVC